MLHGEAKKKKHAFLPVVAVQCTFYGLETLFFWGPKISKVFDRLVGVAARGAPGGAPTPPPPVKRGSAIENFEVRIWSRPLGEQTPDAMEKIISLAARLHGS
ncbi:unnamed protein product [Durusdinium trenchii]|uniref:Uncharacterized protein n=1 Tax=Durusdinium trenchii TaxID=1381693 RepID=A0ABP0LF31_9DINO